MASDRFPRARRFTMNLRKKKNFFKDKDPRCPVCSVSWETYADRFGDAPTGSLSDEQLLAGLCSWRCYAVYYGLVDFDAGQYRCLCGEHVHVGGADCIACSRSPGENDTMVFKIPLLGGLIPA